MRSLSIARRGSVVVITVMTAAAISACSTGRLRGVLSTIFDGVPESGAPATESPQPEPDPVSSDPETRLLSAPAAPSAAATPSTRALDLEFAPAPFESLQTWEAVLAALPVGVDGGADWVGAVQRGLVAPRLLPQAERSTEQSPTLETLIALTAGDPRHSALDLDVRITPTAVESDEAADFYGVRFPHSSHTTWLGCGSCHPGVLSGRTGMRGILEGQNCGRCHGRVSFDPDISCGRCHPSLVPLGPDALDAELASAGAQTVEASPEVIQRGATVYKAMCGMCHGEAGDGRGPLSGLLDPKPRDFTSGKYKFRTTLPTSIPTDLDIFTTITRGVPGTSMPTFAALPRQDRWALTHYVKTLSMKFATSTPQPIPTARPPEATPELLETGRSLYVEAGCNLCHGDTGGGDGPSAARLVDDWGNPIKPFNFTSGRPLKGGTGPDGIYRALMTGLQGTPMPGFGDALEPEQGWALVSHVQRFFGQVPQPFAVKGDVQFRRVPGATAAPDTVSFGPARFPHWFHRIRFKCASCHPSIFEMQAGKNAVSMDALRSGQFCGKCHNGTVAWEIGFSTCGKCHPGVSTSSVPPPSHGMRTEPSSHPTVAPTGVLRAAVLMSEVVMASLPEPRAQEARPEPPAARSRTDPLERIRIVPQTTGAVLASAWVLKQFLDNGRWTGENATIFEQDARDADGEAGAFRFRRSMVQGALSLRNSQWILGPRLLTANVGVDLSVRRESIDAGVRSSPGAGRVLGYDVSATARPDSWLSFGAFTARDHAELPRLFGTTREQWLTRRGGQVRLTRRVLSSTVQWTRLQQESETQGEQGRRRDGEARTIIETSLARRTDLQTLTVEHHRDHREDLIDPDLSFPLQVTRLRHAIDLDRDVVGRSLVSNFSVNQRGGRLRRNHRGAEVRLDFALGKRLLTRSIARAERVTIPAFRRDRRSVDLQARHRLYESLVTTGSVRSAREDLQTGDRRLRGRDLLLEYRKKLIGGGRLSVSASRRWSWDNNQFAEREDLVQGEVHAARIAAPFRLEQSRVDAASIVLTDAEETTVYQVALDYTIRVIGDFTEIGILPQGLIADGQTLLVEYRHSIPPSSRIGMTRSDLDVSADYGWITPHFRVHGASRKLLQGYDDGYSFGRAGRATGMRLRFGARNVRLLLLNEWQVDDARNLSFNAWQLGQSLSWTAGPNLALVANLDENFTVFRVPVRRESRASAALDVSWQATPGLSMRVAGAARERHDSLGFEERVYSANVDADWKRSALSLSASVNRDWGGRDGRRFHGSRLTTRLSRLF